MTELSRATGNALARVGLTTIAYPFRPVAVGSAGIRNWGLGLGARNRKMSAENHEPGPGTKNQELKTSHVFYAFPSF